MTAIKIVSKESYKREDKGLKIYTDYWNSMQFIEYNKENHPILNQILDIPAKLQNQGKQFMLSKFSAHVESKRNGKGR